jgi:hypothetical protein
LPKLAFPEQKGKHHRHTIKEIAYCKGSCLMTGSYWPGLHLPKLAFPEHKGALIKKKRKLTSYTKKI